MHAFNQEQVERLSDQLRREFVATKAREPTQDETARLRDTAAERYGRLATKWTVACSDGTKIVTESFDEVQRFPNTKSRRIVGLSIANRALSPLQVTFEIERASDKSYVSYSVEGPDDRAVAQVRAMDELVDIVTPSYDWARRFHGAFLTFGTIGASFSFLFTILIVYGKDYVKSLGGDWFWASFGVAIALGVLWAITQQYLFPWTMFAINEGQKLQRTYERRRTFVGVLVVLAIVVSVIANFLTDYVRNALAIVFGGTAGG